jgi:hypothetical protein
VIQGFTAGLLNRKLIYQTDLPSFQRDFASLKTLDHGTGPNITFTRASDATYFDANGVLQTATSDTPRFDHDPADGSSLGLLIEEARTNSIRNSQGGGAVVGAPGTVPTDWFIGAQTGISTEVVATGTENGLAYVDVKFTGTNSTGDNVFPNLFFDTSTTVVASSGQTWTSSFYTKIVAGSTAGLTNANIQFVELTAAGVVVSALNTPFTPTSSLARYSATRTLTGATTERVYARFICTLPDGAQIGGSADGITLRFAAPQLEQGAFPTSYIPTTTAAATRAADSAIVTPISSFYNQAEGTLFAEGSAAGTTGFGALFSVDDTTANERIQIRRDPNTAQGYLNAVVTDNNVSQATLNTASATWTTDTEVKRVALAVKADDLAVSMNGATALTDTSATLPTVTRMLIGDGVNSTRANGHIRKIAYWPKRLTDTLLEQLTT